MPPLLAVRHGKTRRCTSYQRRRAARSRWASSAGKSSMSPSVLPESIPSRWHCRADAFTAVRFFTFSSSAALLASVAVFFCAFSSIVGHTFLLLRPAASMEEEICGGSGIGMEAFAAKDMDDQTPEITEDGRSSPGSSDPALPRALSSSRLNARAAEFVPRTAPIRHGHAPAARPVMHVFHQTPPSAACFGPGPSSFEYYGGGGAGAGAGAGGFGEHEGAHTGDDPDLSSSAGDGLSDEVIQKITKQVEYYFSDANLATTEHLMRFITKDPEGFVPISVVAAFKKIKALVHNNTQLAMALQTSTKLVVSDDGKKVRRQQPFNESDMEELQSRIVMAENLPEDHCYQNLMKVFSSVGSVKTIRTCYPQPSNGAAAATNRPTKLEMHFGNRLHAFVEYETVEDAEKAVAELNNEKNWRSGLRVRVFPKLLTKHGQGRGRKVHEAEFTGEEDVSTLNEKQVEDAYHTAEVLHEQESVDSFNDKDGTVRRGRGRSRGGRGRGRGQHLNNNRVGGHAVGTPPSSHHLIQSEREQPVGANKQPPGPRMPDGTRGFTMGRGKPVVPTSTI
ncbi:serine threonine protein kinase [Musa troglodytarum]|uniref:Serine threonine protein kinase n=1 Tax=Musa troglodytarum TaxID=320322 RepID=A0A9E7JM11_9LILI|nr:serine threonine protein kinase [Musa troglodytarum]